MSSESDAEREYEADRARWHHAAGLLNRVIREAFGRGPRLVLVQDAAAHDFVTKAKRFIELAGETSAMRPAPYPALVGRLWFDEPSPCCGRFARTKR